MGRLTRAEAQERNRAAVLAAARDEFAERGFRDTKIDGIAERAGLTRGAVYSNFPGKRALYFAVLAEQAERRAPGSPPRPVRTVGAALAALARAWVAGLPLATAGPGAPPFAGTGLSADVLGEEPVRRAYAQLMTLDALLLGLALERLGPGRGERRVRLAQAVLTTLHGASRMAADAPGFVEPFDVIAACEHLASLGMDDAWRPPHLPWAAPARPADEPWSPPRALDLVRGEPARLAADGVVAVLGLHRLDAAEEAVRAAPPGTRVTVAMVTAEPGELAPLARLALAELCVPLRRAFPPTAWPPLQVVFDYAGALAAAAGVPGVGDTTEAAVRVEAGRITARAEGRGACHTAARP
ncbi:AcrR family transcriptional regulator [Thermocatellispora tengchongensis]|uniref:AcrR family transcriptional regulator n=1 Tax=Thermocatellispora tengchongensis TaxID=1073253 RepID=A0A840P7X6_9ACTN|nr:helix-turn-helix domain-containing protein [Thermocatellispora tengchongensis]MBB5132115.1 AcrR family transcriptional regulator [Thermocatellispora tengchongensis]